MLRRYPFMISVPHGGTRIPAALHGRFALSPKELRYYCDPATRRIFGFGDRVAAYIDTPVSRMAVDLNRPPLPLPGKDPDGVIKVKTIDGRGVYVPGRFPSMPLIQRLMMAHYFPYHQRIDELIDQNAVEIAFDCHSMLPFGSCSQNDAGKSRPLICLGNNGDSTGRAGKGGITTCPQAMIRAIAEAFRTTLGPGAAVSINDPFSGGFITNAHYWRKGIPWIQIEVSRELYEDGSFRQGNTDSVDRRRTGHLKEQVWSALTLFWDSWQT